MIAQRTTKFGLSVLIIVASICPLQSCRSTETTGAVEKSLDSPFDPHGYQGVAQQFFANYGLIPQKGFDAFKAQQKLLLASNMTTVVLIKSQKKTYSGPDGYFASLGDWSAIFSTGDDFYNNIYAGPQNTVYARLHGNLQMKDASGSVATIPDSGHCWTETFVFDSNSKIQKLTVDMKIGVNCPGGAPINPGAY